MSGGKISRFVQAIRDGLPTKFTEEVNGRNISYLVNAQADGYDDPKNLTPARMWKSQPHLRTVVEFQALKVAQLKLHAYKAGEESAERLTTGKVASLLRRPNPEDTMQEVIEALVADWALYNNAYLHVYPNEEGSFYIRPIPADWVTPISDTFYKVKYYEVSGSDGTPKKIKPENIIRFKGWTPGDPEKGTSPVETLRLILAEQHSARVYRDQVWRKGGRTNGIITRPKDAPAWTNEGRRRFFQMVKAFTGDNGPRAGEDLLLEDGMDYKRVGLAAKEEQFVESTKLSLETVCQVYHVNPTMVGMLDNANYSNVREFRKGLYGDTLGPIITRLENRLNSFLLPMIGAPEDEFVEFNVEQMLRGSFEEQAEMVSKATGAPWQTRAEARKLFNLPFIEGTDDLVLPLNIAFSPEEAQEEQQQQQPTEEPVEEVSKDALQAVLEKFLTRQGKSIAAKKNAGADWWDESRWNRELTADLKEIGCSEEFAELLATSINAKSHSLYTTDNEGQDITHEIISLATGAIRNLALNSGIIPVDKE